MPPTSNFFRASRPVFRAGFTASQARNAFGRTGGFRQNAGRRFQSTTADDAAAAKASWFKRMWDSPIGLKTVHFWAPVMKWAIVLAGVSDFARPAEKLSLTQNGALTATGIIWTRWCLIIKPKNYLLAAVNFFLGVVGVIQVTRIVMYNQSQKGLHVNPDEIKDEVKEAIKS
ncbi:hypothetical protein QBC33DRAFT_241327 [Phialemonium atrogriseum]|uniref:Mitochondrial pyruvate carrier n=1 Tax=Phialemonium atrogriseum TaxID=1093897 RepID=A0AAJ0BWW5_9PEZI|nr:uncharacterized protein QBC33DRAFT_241327 [Phialemonium atrogriseum]KAK1763566.1 hypothetical protein QBC33DRAFT_241327 [Phialemonium atrogriseum]